MNTTPASERLLQRIEWRVLKRLDGLLHGDYRTLFRGFGLDLADLREYQVGDDVRHIEWNTTARLGTTYVRQFNEDRDVSAWFIVDMSGSMSFGAGERKKRDVAAEFVAALASVLARHGNRCGAWIFTDAAHDVMPPRTGRGNLLRMLSSIERARPRPTSAMTSLAEQIDAAALNLRRRSLVFVISDFISASEWTDSLGRLAMRHEVIAVRPVDPLETSLPNLGMMTLRDAETGEQLWVDSSDPSFRRRFQAMAQAREDHIAQQFAHAGVDAMELSTDEPMLDTLMRFAHLRKRKASNQASTNAPMKASA
jgi:uncharacterized protein (DUF58 family)